jgi:hypothetical protein
VLPSELVVREAVDEGVRRGKEEGEQEPLAPWVAGCPVTQADEEREEDEDLPGLGVEHRLEHVDAPGHSEQDPVRPSDPQVDLDSERGEDDHGAGVEERHHALRR